MQVKQEGNGLALAYTHFIRGLLLDVKVKVCLDEHPAKTAGRCRDARRASFGEPKYAEVDDIIVGQCNNSARWVSIVALRVRAAPETGDSLASSAFILWEQI